ncbi:MAG: radical SAM family heme chaperone HemW [Desulfobacteraceae bacterium]|nr:MAG: radical SAM family heme chaperone HemW [Desulfobacteraceae bacterium]
MSDPLALYIHVPFCVKKCGYCDFYSIEDHTPKNDYVSGLITELRLRAQGLKESMDPRVTSIYFGGGTPSVLDLDHLGSILDEISCHFHITPDTEITLEVNPGTVDPNYLHGLRQMGINRLSIGVQSFDDNKLRFLDRIHTGKQALDCYEQAVGAGFDNIGIDLIYAVPGERPWEWQQDLNRAADLSPAHLSCYMLMVEPGTLLNASVVNGSVDPPPPESRCAMFTSTSIFLKGCRYEHYEISNFARSHSLRSRHNTHYWKRLPYMGFGAGAHSFDGSTRSWNPNDVYQYIDDLGQQVLPASEEETLTTDQVLLELIMLGLRTCEGIDIRQFNRFSAAPFEKKFEKIIRQLKEKGWCRVTPETLALTLEGQSFLNPVLEMFAKRI